MCHHRPCIIQIVSGRVKICNIDSETCGYKIQPDQQVAFLNKDFEREPAVIVDDMKNTGKTLNQVVSFWTQGTRFPAPVVEVIGKNDSIL